MYGQTTVEKPFMNVQELWPVYDTICVCRTLYGGESKAPGFFTSFAAFAANEYHVFFKGRTEGSLNPAYCNQRNGDTMDFGYRCYSIGVAFFSPGVRKLGLLAEDGSLSSQDFHSAQYWECDLPKFCGVEFKVNQDVVAEGPALDFAPGYGPTGNGGGYEYDTSVDEVGQTLAHSELNPQFLYSATQGVPNKQNRREFKPPIEIPRTATIEARIYIDKEARAQLALMGGPDYYEIPRPSAAQGIFNSIPARYGIQISLYGQRIVQQRGQYHR